MEKIEINLADNQKELVIRNGQALPLKEPVQVKITGTITAPALYANARELNPKECHVLVVRDDKSIILVVNETNPYMAVVAGQLTLSEEYKKFGINSDKKFTAFELADLIKMNRNCFGSIDDSMKLVTGLKNLEISVSAEIKKTNDNRANKQDIFKQTCKTNIPENFKMTMEIYKGQPKQTFDVEIYIDANNYNCQLVSPDAKDIENSTRDNIIDAEIAKFKDIVIIEQ